jgi:hypothetical protein
MCLELIIAFPLSMFMHIDESGRDDQPLGIDHQLARKRSLGNGSDLSASNATLRTASRPLSGSITRPLAITTS